MLFPSDQLMGSPIPLFPRRREVIFLRLLGLLVGLLSVLRRRVVTGMVAGTVMAGAGPRLPWRELPGLLLGRLEGKLSISSSMPGSGRPVIGVARIL